MFGRRAGEFAVCDCDAAAAAVGTATDDGDDGDGDGVKMIINSGRRATIHTPRRRFMVEMHEAFDCKHLTVESYMVIYAANSHTYYC